MTAITLTPAHDRDYTSKAAVLKGFLASRDFVMQPSGRLTNLPQIEESEATEVRVRYQRSTRIVVLVKDAITGDWRAE